MNYHELSPQGEKLLKEIIELKNNNIDNIEHWNTRFESLSGNEEDLLRSTFSELRENDYINTQWADNIPYFLSITVDGHNYFINKKKFERESRKLSHREWKIAIISSVIGACIGLIPWICSLFGGVQ